MKTAQEAYEQALKNNFEDTSIILRLVEEAVDFVASKGCFAATIPGPFKITTLEKACLELEKNGYWVQVFPAGQNPETKEVYGGLNVSFKMLPVNTRESYQHAS